MIQDSSELSTGAVLKADVCIVGGGPAGISIARALAGSGKKVLLLESGGRDVEGASQALAGATQDVGYDRLSSNRLRRLGGTTGHWAGQSIPLDPIDLRARDWVPGSGWPIPYSELERWLPAAVDACGLGAEPFTWEAWSGAVRLPDALPFSDRIVVQPLRFSTPPRDFGKHFGAELGAKEDVQVVLHASVTHLETGKEGVRVARAHVRGAGDRTLKVEAKTFVLATGALENSRLLLLSQAATGKPFGNTHDLVGRYVMEHPNFDADRVMLTRHDAAGLLRKPGRRVQKTRLRFDLRLSDAEQERLKILNHSMFLTDLDRSSATDGAVKALLEAEGVASKDAALAVRFRLEHAPYAESRVTLGTAKDAHGSPQLHLHYAFGDLEGQTLAALEEALAAELGRVGLGRVRIEARPLRAWEKKAGWQDHHLGGTRMSADPTTGVVDPDCRVHGMQNLYCAGSSVFPTGGHANPTLNLVAMSLRLADHLRSQP